MQLCVFRSDGLFCGPHQRGEVIPVREADGLHRRENSNPCAPRKEQLGTWSRNTIGAFDDYRQQWESRVNRDTKCSLLEWQELCCIAPGAFRKNNQRISAFGGELDALVDCNSARPAGFPIDFNDSNPPHSCRYKRDTEQLFLGQEPSLDREKPKQQRDVVGRDVVRDDHVPRVRIDVLESFHAELHRWDAKERAGPPLYDPSVERRGWAKYPEQDDER